VKVLVLGSKGRFALAFQQLFRDKVTHFALSFREFNTSGLKKLISDNTRFSHVLWTFGAGSSNSAAQSEELEAIQLLRQELKIYAKNSLEPNPSFIFFSSGAVYGKNAGEVDEKSITNPGTEYATKKLECEIQIRQNLVDFFQEIRILRIANAYSLNDSRRGLGLVESIYNNIQNKITVQTTVHLESLRQYGTHFDYAKYIFRNFINRRHSTDPIELINVASPYQLSIRDIISTFEQVFEKKLAVKVDGDNLDTVILKSRYSSPIIDEWESLANAIRSNIH